MPMNFITCNNLKKLRSAIKRPWLCRTVKTKSEDHPYPEPQLDRADRGTWADSRRRGHGWEQLLSETIAVPGCSCQFCVARQQEDPAASYPHTLSPHNATIPQGSMPPLSSVYDVLYPSRNNRPVNLQFIPCSGSLGQTFDVDTGYGSTRPSAPAHPCGRDWCCSETHLLSPLDDYFDAPPPYTRKDPLSKL